MTLQTVNSQAIQESSKAARLADDTILFGMVRMKQTETGKLGY